MNPAQKPPEITQDIKQADEKLDSVRIAVLAQITRYHQENMRQMELIRQILKDNNESLARFKASQGSNPFRRCEETLHAAKGASRRKCL